MKTDTVILSSNAEVSKIEIFSFALTLSLTSSQEEADTKVVFLAEVLLEDVNRNTTIRSVRLLSLSYLNFGSLKNW